jgi:hypothetical protein
MSYSPPPPISLAIQSTSAARSALPVYHRLRDSIEAYLTIVVAARAVGRWIEHQTGWTSSALIGTSQGLVARHGETGADRRVARMLNLADASNAVLMPQGGRDAQMTTGDPKRTFCARRIIRWHGA